MWAIWKCNSRGPHDDLNNSYADTSSFQICPNVSYFNLGWSLIRLSLPIFTVKSKRLDDQDYWRSSSVKRFIVYQETLLSKRLTDFGIVMIFRFMAMFVSASQKKRIFICNRRWINQYRCKATARHVVDSEDLSYEF